MMHTAYTLGLPQPCTTSVIFASPHSGRAYSKDFLRSTVLDTQTIRSSEDAFVDELIACAPRYGAQTIAATAPRAYIDLNRNADELDPAVVSGLRRVTHNPRISSGLGVVPRVVANGRAIYRGKMHLNEAKARLDAYWHPYHDQLRRMLDVTRNAFGQAILVDCHSMPHEAIDALHQHSEARPDVVLGDRFGAASAAHIVDQVEAAFKNAGLRVARNAPFAGAFIAQHYGRPSRNQHVVQIEIDRALYMDEETISRGPQFRAFQRLMEQVISEVADFGRASQMPLAAE
ncbi:N-formylglutamate amidohydrolase [Dinoroseobacter shibae DFL 12 = DSM 16493]|jgi:N-formylglutamate amidohydrolase|uniref:N-formylglutamate amidohydrolase n=1 Tax=Dinoroseobacter shibae (strain DSM 16493 / NCIMB 14021 / DFL 12) TaxID=398580 RepID=A8LMZ1_DINSH|nr:MULTISPECIES: N-formylglutamate amidohydrolase [Dinoroseobacter]ABV92135.1 N-formylglutamate amidohydrolase [Dinoroseobacter shibae DFL 12 = DSM 16493]MDD9718929.1 N-formylglutamate amidohydrolase [Dinoroseobacter sp. PD6]URF47093.1 N-formylglutamate amidohydrolase [Dinoroseobacter shibae]URF51404.1 N-formylglutamate amidohydrolase [Dinoroseobacter shibae]